LIRQSSSGSTTMAAFAVVALGLLIGGCAGRPAVDTTALSQSFFDAGALTDIVESRSGLHCRIFHPRAWLMPETQSSQRKKHPLVIWGNGTHASPASYRSLLEHWASHELIVVASMSPNAGRGVEMRDCLNDILEQQSESGSPFYQRVNSERVAAAGHSQGGGGAIMLGRDPRITTVVAIQPSVLGERHNPQAAANQTGPMLLLSGQEDFSASAATNQQPVFDSANVAVFWANLRGATHFAPMDTGGSFRGPMTAWLRWKLLDDSRAAHMFDGEECVLCVDERWLIQTR
jgi:predicted dienelactone hydrolase